MNKTRNDNLKSAFRRRIIVSLFLFIFIELTAAPIKQKTVLVLLPGNTENPAMNLIFEGVQQRMVSLGSERIIVIPARVDSLAEGSPELKKLRDEWFRVRYGTQPVDLIVAVSTPPLLMAIEFRNKYKPGTPIISCCNDRQSLGDRASPITGIVGQYPWKENFDLLKQLFPQTRHVALVGGATPFDRMANGPLGEIVRKEQPVMEFIDLSGLTAADQIERAKTLPPNTVLLLGSALHDAAGNDVQQGTQGLRATLAHESNAPLLFITEVNFGSAGLGGYMVNWPELGAELGEMGLSVLSGRISPNAPMATSKSIHLRLDWRELDRWKVPLSRVPSQASVEFRPPSLWEANPQAVLFAIAALASQALAIVFLLAQRRQRQASRNQLAERLRFETLLTEASTAFANRTESELDRAIHEALQRMGLFFNATYASIWQLALNSSTIARTHIWTDNSGESTIDVDPQQFPDTVSRLLRGDVISFSQKAELAGLADRESFRELGIASFLAIPIQNGEQILGALCLVNQFQQTSWPQDLVSRLRIIAGMLGSALARQRATEALRESEIARQRLNEKAAQMNRVTEMGQLVASVAHELAQPLTAILSNAQAASRLTARPVVDLPEIQAALSDIIDDNERARAVLKNLRDAFKKHTITPHAVDLNEIVGKVVLMVKSSAYLRDVRLQTSLVPGRAQVNADEVPVQQILLNLISNAMDAMGHLHPKDRLLLIHTRIDKESGVLIVEDHGPGIPDTLKASIFAPFFTTKNDGLGMGLTICQELLRTMGGSIGLEDGFGGGTRFRVKLPVACEPQLLGRNHI